MTLTGNLSVLYEWKLFAMHSEALQFFEELKGIDISLGLPPFSMNKLEQGNEKLNRHGVGSSNLGGKTSGMTKVELDHVSVAIESPNYETKYHTSKKPTPLPTTLMQKCLQHGHQCLRLPHCLHHTLARIPVKVCSHHMV